MKVQKIKIFLIFLIQTSTSIYFILFIGLVLRILFCCLEPGLSRDSLEYLNLIRAISEKGGFCELRYFWPNYWIPLLPILLVYLCGIFCGDFFKAGVILNSLVGTGIIIVVYATTKDLFNRKIAILAAWLCAFHPTLIALACEIQRENLYLLFFILGIWFTFRSIRNNSVVDSTITGIFIGFGILTRYESIEIFLFALLYWGYSVMCKKITWKNFFYFIGVMSATVSLIIVLFYLSIMPFSELPIIGGNIIKHFTNR